MKKIMIAFVLVLVLSSFVHAQIFQVNKDYDLKRACSNGGFFCENDFTCNITIINPDGTLVTNNSPMTFQPTFFNISILAANNTQLGFGEAINGCNNVTKAGIEVFTIEFTADGKPFQQFPIQFVIIILGLLLIATGSMVEKLKLFKSIGSMGMMTMGVLTLFPGYSFINWTTLMGKVIGFSLIGIGSYFLINDSFSRNKQEEYFTQEGEDDEE